MITTAISPYASLVDRIVPIPKSPSINILRNLFLIVSFSIFLAVCAQAAIIIPHISPVPITLQTLSVLLTGAALGSKRGGLSTVLYLTEGAAGLPIFAGGAGGFIRLFGYTGGYLWAFPIAAFVTGWLCEKHLDRNFLTCALSMLPGTILIYILGVSWLAVILHLNLRDAFNEGMLPFIPGDILKICTAAILLPSVWKGIQYVEQKKNTRQDNL